MRQQLLSQSIPLVCLGKLRLRVKAGVRWDGLTGSQEGIAAPYPVFRKLGSGVAGFRQDHSQWEPLWKVCICLGFPFSNPTPPCPQATVLCDLLLLHILPKRHYYKQKKFKYAEDMGPGEVSDLQLLEQVPSATQSLTVCWRAGCCRAVLPGPDLLPHIAYTG